MPMKPRRQSGSRLAEPPPRTRRSWRGERPVVRKRRRKMRLGALRRRERTQRRLARRKRSGSASGSTRKPRRRQYATQTLKEPSRARWMIGRNWLGKRGWQRRCDAGMSVKMISTRSLQISEIILRGIKHFYNTELDPSASLQVIFRT